MSAAARSPIIAVVALVFAETVDGITNPVRPFSEAIVGGRRVPPLR